jgi:hypothetical protein
MPEGTAVPSAAVAIRAPVATRPSGSTVEDDNFLLPTCDWWSYGSLTSPPRP